MVAQTLFSQTGHKKVMDSFTIHSQLTEISFKLKEIRPILKQIYVHRERGIYPLKEILANSPTG